MNSSSRHISLLAACVASTVCLTLLLATSPWQALAWDEGDTILRAESIGERAQAAGDAAWPYTVCREGHPPLAGILVAAGTRLAPSWFDPLTRARMGPMLWFSVAIGVMCYRLQRDYGVLAVSGTAAAAALTMPRLFAHAHFATLDGPLTAAWVIAWASFGPACRRPWWIAAFGLALGLTLAAKFTGWLAIVPFVVWTVLYRDTKGMRALLLGVPLAVAVFVAVNPPLWEAPWSGLRTFFELNLNRGVRVEHNITTQFLGRFYNLDFPLPWYNTLLWTAITVSPMLLLLGGLGIAASVRRWRTDRASMLLVCQWGTLIVARALPWAPPHDAERLILPSFAFLAALVGVGTGRALYRESLMCPPRIIAQGWAKVAMALALGAATFDSIAYFPLGLSFYSRLIGGLRGAVALGMEPTYYWDSLDRQALAWLDAHTRDGERVVFAAAPPANLELLARWGWLRAPTSGNGTPRWYVLQRRPSALQPADVWLTQQATAAYQRSLSGVRLLEVFAYEDYPQARSAIGQNGEGD